MCIVLTVHFFIAYKRPIDSLRDWSVFLLYKKYLKGEGYMFKKNKRVYVAYADYYGRNEFLIRNGSNYYVLTSQRTLNHVSADDAYITLKLIHEKILSFRGVGSFKKVKSNPVNGIVQDVIATGKNAIKYVTERSK